MRKKRSGMFILVGALCAVFAVLVVQRRLRKDQAPVAAFEGTDILLASRDVQYGELLVLEGHGENANVMVVSGWPSDRKPEGALTDGAEITESTLRAGDSFVKHEVILAGKVVPEDDFIPNGMLVERVNIDKDDIRSGRLRAGMTVDVLQVIDNVPRNFMRNVRVYAVGELDPQKRPVKQDNPSPNAFLLIKKEDRLAFLRAKYNSSFLLVEAVDPAIEGPLLVDGSVRQEAKRAEVQSMLDEGQALMAAGDYEKAFPVLRRAAELYPEINDLSAEAAGQAAACRQNLAARRYEQAVRAVEQDKDYSLALHHLDTLDSEFADVQSVIRQGTDLRRVVDAALEERRCQTRYASALTDLPASLAGGDLPRADQLLGELKLLKDQGFKPEGDEQGIEKAIADYQEKVREVRKAYDSDKMVLESYLRQGDLAQAQEKLQQIKEKFPAHPEVAQLEASLAAAKDGGQ